MSREEEKVVWEESLPLSGNEKAIGLSSDPIGQTFWIHTDKSILEVLIRDEDRDVWRGKLSRGDFTDALAFARVCLTSTSLLVTVTDVSDESAEGRGLIEARR